MIPSLIDSYLHEHGIHYSHHVHDRAIAAQRLAAAEHVSGERVAKVVVVEIDGRLALAVVPAPDHVDLDALQMALKAHQVSLVPEQQFRERFWPCEPGAEPALSIFGLPIYVDAELAREPWILMRAGTHEDAIRIDTDDWLLSENARIVDQLSTTIQ